MYVKTKWKNHKVFGVGTSDLPATTKSYPVWHSIHRRCYSEVYQKNKPTYIGCSVCEDWQLLSTFDDWFNDNYVEGFQLDKDIVKPGNKVYCPEYCIFLPNEVNCAVNVPSKWNGLPQGVSFRKQSNKYVSQMSFNDENGKRKSRQILLSNDIEECFRAYKYEKEVYVRFLAEKWKDSISQKAYDALMKYEVVK